MSDPNQVLDSFYYGAERLVKLVEGLSDVQLDYKAAPEDWSIREIIHHLGDDGDVYAFLIKRAIATPGARAMFDGFPGNEAWAKALHHYHRSTQPVVALIMAHREAIRRLVSHFPDAWENELIYVDGACKEVGRSTVGKIIEMLDEHMDEHLVKITELRRAQGLE